MVEGPQCRLKTLKLAALLLRQRLQQCIGGSACELHAAATRAGLLQRHVVECFSVGKECFIVFAGGGALRLHFAMSGGAVTHSVQNDGAAAQSGYEGGPSLVFSSVRVDLCKGATASVRSAAYVQMVRARRNRDVLSVPFDMDGAVAALRGRPD